MRVANLENENRKIVSTMGNFHVLEYARDASVSPVNAAAEYFMGKMGVRRRQIVIDMNGKDTAIIQAGAMQWMAGNVQATTGVKGVGDLFGKMVKGAVTKESAVKPEYTGSGILVLGDVPDPENYSTYFMKIDGVKFKRKVVPGDTLQFEIHLLEPIRRGVAVVEAKAFVGETLACEAVLMAQVVKNKK